MDLRFLGKVLQGALIGLGGISGGGESVILRIRDLPGAFRLRICGTDRGNAALVVERSGRTGQDCGKCDLILRDIGGNA